MRRPYNGTYPVTRPFGVYDVAYKNYPGSRHPGTDYGLSYRTPLIAAISGTAQVIDRGTAKTGRGREVVITNGSTQVKYCHMDSFSISNGQQVTEGQVIGHSGFTGYVVDSAGNIGTIGGTHLHFEVLLNGVYTNPESQYNQGETMDYEDVKYVRYASLHRLPSDAEVKGDLGQKPSSAASNYMKSQEWLSQNHILKVAYPEAQKKIIELNKKLQEGQQVTQAELDALAKMADNLEQAIKVANK